MEFNQFRWAIFLIIFIDLPWMMYIYLHLFLGLVVFVCV